VVTIAGAGEITFSNNNTLYCGSTLNFTNPTAAAVETIISGAGTLFVNGGNGITVGADAKVEVLVDPNTNTWIKNDTAKTLTLLIGSRGWEYRGQGSTESDLRVINYGGKFHLSGQVTLTLTGGNAQTPAYTQTPFLFGTPTLEIRNGCVLDASEGVQINGGQVLLTSNAALEAARQYATIIGKYTMTGGEFGFHQTPVQIGNEKVWGWFNVFGDVFWSGGTYLPGLNCAPGAPEGGDAHLRNNQWMVTGVMIIDATGASKPTIGPVPQFLPQGQQPGGTWRVIAAQGGLGGIHGDDPIVPAGWSLRPVPVDGTNKGYTVRK
jgi:hypothetical protein